MSLDISLIETRPTYVYDGNITHNLSEMAANADLYIVMWRPEKLKITKAKEMIQYLENGISNLESDPEYYKQFNPKNGWGNYEGLLKFAKGLLAACKENPEAEIKISR